MLCFSRDHGSAAARLAGTGALGVGECFAIGVRAYIGGGQLVFALPATFQIGGQFVSRKERAFLNADSMVAEDCDVRGDRELFRQASFRAHLKTVHAGILSLVKPEISDLHEFPFPATEDRLNR